MELTLITPTGNRPEAMALCERYMARQSQRWAQWIVVDDGAPATPLTMGQTLLRPAPLWAPGQPSTQYRNMLLGLEAVQGDAVLVIEDDEWYAADYLKISLKLLAQADMVGEIPSRYYHVQQRRWRNMENTNMASLSQTGFRRAVFPLLMGLCRKQLWLDTALWHAAQRGSFRAAKHQSAQVVGIKGLPGRPGMSNAHQPQGARWTYDPDLAHLRNWIGADADLYQGYFHA